MEHENRLTNEANIIKTIRLTMTQLKTLAAQYRRNQFEQQVEYINDPNSPSKIGRFTDLAEDQSTLVSEYNSSIADIKIQLTAYDRFCENNHLDHSEPWQILLADLKSYRSGINFMANFVASNDGSPSPSDSAKSEF